MNAGVLHNRLLSKGAQLTVADGRLRFRAPAGVLTEQDHADLQRSKPEMIALFAECCGGCGAVLYEVESRAAGRCQRCRAGRLNDRVQP